MTFVRYACSQYFHWLGIFSLIISLIAIIPMDNRGILIGIVVAVLLLAFLVPLLESCCRRKFNLKTIGKSKVSLEFSDLFREECFVLTTNRYFDIDPTGKYIAENSLLGKFVSKYFSDNILELETLIKAELEKIKCPSKDGKYDYGTCIKIKVDNKIIYFLAFTDRYKSDQPINFYQKTIQCFLEKMVDENHGKTIAVPLFGENNDLSNSGFPDPESSFVGLISMINIFGISNQKSTLKIKVVALSETRKDLISTIGSYSK